MHCRISSGCNCGRWIAVSYPTRLGWCSVDDEITCPQSGDVEMYHESSSIQGALFVSPMQSVLTATQSTDICFHVLITGTTQRRTRRPEQPHV